MIESRNTSKMSGIIGHSGQGQHSSRQDYRLLTADLSQLSEDDLPGDLQSLSWLTSVDVPRLQQMATERLDLSSGPQSVQLGQPTAHLTTSGGQATLHLQSNIQNRVLGGGNAATHNTSMTHYSLNGQSSPAFQSPATVYQASSHQVFALAQTGQQCTSAAQYGSTSFAVQSQFSQSHHIPYGNQDIQPQSFPKPIYSYSCLIAMALKNSKTGSLPVSEIYTFMKEHFPYFKTAPDGWKNSVRHNLSLNKCFEKVENKLGGSSRKGCLWALNPAKIDKMEEEMQKWKHKDLPAIRRSMANPDELDKLITDRPESCRRKDCDAGVTRMSSCLGLPGRLQPQPVMTLSLQCTPLHHLAQAQIRLAPSSPALGQTPPHHTPDLTHSSLTQHTRKPAHDYHSLHAEASTEVDALDPSIMDFALQGNLWEDVKQESFSLETLDAFTSSPLRLSDCELAVPSLTPVSGQSSPSFSDLHVMGLYTTYPAIDGVSTQYMGRQGSSKPIALL